MRKSRTGGNNGPFGNQARWERVERDVDGEHDRSREANGSFSPGLTSSGMHFRCNPLNSIHERLKIHVRAAAGNRVPTIIGAQIERKDTPTRVNCYWHWPVSLSLAHKRTTTQNSCETVSPSRGTRRRFITARFPSARWKEKWRDK